MVTLVLYIKECEAIAVTGSSQTYPLWLALVADYSAPSTPFNNYCVDIKIPAGFKWYLIDLRYCRLLPLSVYRHIISNIHDNTGSATKYFYVNTATNDLLTTSDKLLIASKNWTLSVQNV